MNKKDILLGHNIKRLRHDLGYTQDQLTARIKVLLPPGDRLTKQSICRWELNIESPSTTQRLIALATSLQTTVEELCCNPRAQASIFTNKSLDIEVIKRYYDLLDKDVSLYHALEKLSTLERSALFLLMYRLIERNLELDLDTQLDMFRRAIETAKNEKKQQT